MIWTHEHWPTGIPVRVLDDDGVAAELEMEGGGSFLAPSGEVRPLPDSMVEDSLEVPA